MSRKIHPPRQTELPVLEPGRPLSPEQAYAAECGEDKLLEQQALARKRCSCGTGDGYALKLHKPSCALLPLSRRRA